MITDEDKERVRQATDIVQLVSETVVLRPRGGNDFWAVVHSIRKRARRFT